MNKLIIRMVFLGAFCWGSGVFAQPSSTEKMSGGNLTRYPDFPSKFVASRQVAVWLPSHYDASKRYAVLYMHDGQNVFDGAMGKAGNTWGVVEAMEKLHTDRKIQNCIVVGIWNTPKRRQEYVPRKALDLVSEARKMQFKQEFGGLEVLSDEYLKFIVYELKPFIDAQFRTNPSRQHTFIMGSSMGGLISLYAAMEYPAVFGGAACLSTHWSLSLSANTPDFTNAVLQYLEQQLPRQHKPLLYFDYGTTTLDAWYEVHQLRINDFLVKQRYGSKRWVSKRFEGAEHNEAAWRNRVDIPLLFLLEK